MDPVFNWQRDRFKDRKKLGSPQIIERFYCPIVANGPVFFHLHNSSAREFVINDPRHEIFNIYKAIQGQDKEFFKTLEGINTIWNTVFELKEVYLETIQMLINERQLFYKKKKESISNTEKDKKDDVLDINKFYERLSNVTHLFINKALSHLKEVLKQENIQSTHVIFTQLPLQILNKIKEAPKSGYTKDIDELEVAGQMLDNAIHETFVCEFLNRPDNKSDKEQAAILYYLLNYSEPKEDSYSNLYKLNYPYNGKIKKQNELRRIIDVLKQKDITDKFKKTKIYNLDPRVFLELLGLKNNDYVYLREIPANIAHEEIIQFMKNTKANVMLVTKINLLDQLFYKELNIEILQDKFIERLIGLRDVIIRNY